MADKLNSVKPGDIITASFMNSILAKMALLEEAIAQVPMDELVVVPTIVGKLFGQAAEILKKQGLIVGRAYDFKGRPMDLKSDAKSMVLGQSPAAGSKVGLGTAVDVVLASAEEQPKKPVIHSFKPDPAKSNALVQILGENFYSILGLNTVKIVKINGAAVPEGQGDLRVGSDSRPPTVLKVRVPRALEERLPSGWTEVVVTVAVHTPDGESSKDLHVQSSEKGKVQTPEIHVVEPEKKIPHPGEWVTIKGRYPSYDPGDFEVFFEDIRVVPQYVSEDTIVVRVPEELTPTVSAKHGDTVSISVAVKGERSDAKAVYVAEATPAMVAGKAMAAEKARAYR